ncbi:DUF4097 family beta strand repeat-containing protein [Kribbella sp. CA-293567]|uniref:DUF4097 family beta strand repeat-containing protein n=1 Tax=Kribbella sp. CA-293567 TaxID=3002436 RepID=UPI0022DCE593|nr:DUF4097 family beta strand repeat-containing protein [Kribbella sp. CA-293567]WBQ05767.1 DUF4097 family beta strand repeat-containing protein [Kribbella sp. CA-293567]
MRRGYAAAVDGPITIDVGLFAQDGWVKVQAKPDCARALVGISTIDDEGRSATAVRDAVVEAGPDGGLVVTLHGAGERSDRPGSGSGSVEITVIAPLGSTLVARTDSAHIGAVGVADADLRTQSGDVSVPEAGRVFAETTSGKVTIQRAGDVTATSRSGAISVGATDRVTARTASGGILLGAVSQATARSVSGRLTIRDFRGGSVRADTTSGAITIHATASGSIRAATVSGAIAITATPGTKLTLQTSTATGQVTAPVH